MRKYVKLQILDLLETLSTANLVLKNLIKQQYQPSIINALADQQEAAQMIGSQIEQSEGEGTRAVTLLEQYCYVLWQISQTGVRVTQRELRNTLSELLAEIQAEIKQIPQQIDVLFFPYKASMWDCMESVWRAAKDDPLCNALVIPIPYSDLKDGHVIEEHYEGDKFPEYVSITDYHDFLYGQYHADIAFIHNPFDEFNNVTRVPLKFFSRELKKNVDRLVYIPYYITGSGVYMTHRDMPAYYAADYIVVQSKKAVESFADTIPREKFLPYGNPIADRIIRLEAEKPHIPEAWKPMLQNGQDFGNDKVLMLNTSISKLLKDRDRFLDKIESLFHMLGNMQGITLVWRPHPLLHSSAVMIGEEFVKRLEGLEQYFLENKLGVLDKTPDVGITVALCDAYLGESASSVIHMFGIIGKPRFFIDTAVYKTEKKAEYTVTGYCETGKKAYYVLDELGWIVEKDKENGDFYPLTEIPGRNLIEGRAYKGMELVEDELYVYPEHMEGVFSYRLPTGLRRKHFGETWKRQSGQNRFQQSKEQMIVLPQECIARIEAICFLKGNTNHTWREDENHTVEQYLYYIQTARNEELRGDNGAYMTWFDNLDGTCGQKVYSTVKDSLP